MKKIYLTLAVLVLASLVLSACGGGGAKPKDLLAQIKQRGTIIISTDPNYEPQSFLNTGGKRPSDTKCASDQLTTAEMQGFDVDVAIEIGKRLGVETCFATPNWDLITAGSWADKWDISVGSMTIKPARQEVLYFTTPYYYTPAVVAVLSTSGLTSIDDLAGKAICAGAATTYEDWLNGNLDLPATSIYAQPPAGITVVPLDTDQECAQALAAGRTDFQAYATSATVVDANIASGMPVVQIGGAVFSEDLAVALDKSSTLDGTSLLAAVEKIIVDMHADGTLAALSVQWFGSDLTQSPIK
jgi:polar amino acid transport system substrate-binding protein